MAEDELVDSALWNCCGMILKGNNDRFLRGSTSQGRYRDNRGNVRDTSIITLVPEKSFLWGSQCWLQPAFRPAERFE